MAAILDTVMFGGTRAGKTTLLAQMATVVRKEVEDAGLDLRIAQATVEYFAGAKEALAKLVMAVHEGHSGAGLGVAGTDPSDGVRRYMLGIDNGDGATAAALAFHDYAGEHLQNLTATTADDVRQVLTRAQALLVAVNTPTLMASIESDDPGWLDLHQRSNWPDVLNNVFDEFGSVPPLVMFCPIKCERWLREDPSGQTLLGAVRKGYRLPLRTLERRRATKVLLIPVVTCGAIEFDGFRQAGAPGAPLSIGNAIEQFRPCSDADRMAPRHNDQPLRHLMQVVLDSVDYDQLSAAYMDEAPSRSGSDRMRTYGKAAVNKVGSWLTSAGMRRGEVLDSIDRWAGRQEYQEAARVVAQRATLDPPIYVL